MTGTSDHDVGAAWEALHAVAQGMASAGLRLPLWWRDDDAVRDGPRLRRLLDLGEAIGMTPVLAVIPAAADRSLARALAGRTCAITVHGLSHTAASPLESTTGKTPKIELTGADSHGLAARLAAARIALADRIGRPVWPVVVPPWNRIDPAMARALPAAGLTGLSTFGTVWRREPIAGLTRVNTHIDPVAWDAPAPRHARALRPPPEIVQDIAIACAARRGSAIPVEPLGILTHHAVHDDAAWTAIADTLTRLVSMPAVETADPAALFCLDGRR